jgi:hypothetical protein
LRGQTASASARTLYRREIFGAEGCGAQVVITDTGATAELNLRLLIIGALIGLGVTLVLQGPLAILNSSFTVRAARATALRRLSQ